MSSAEPGTSSAFDRRDFLWKTLVRFDFYVGTTISRAAAVTALNALVVGGIIIKAGEILSSFGVHSHWRDAARLGLGLAGLSALVSTFLSFLALLPYRGRALPRGRSIIFFAHVATQKLEDYVDVVEALEAANATRELAEQVHDMAAGLRRKFKLLHAASWCTVTALLPSLGLLGLSVLAVAEKVPG